MWILNTPIILGLFGLNLILMGFDYLHHIKTLALVLLVFTGFILISIYSILSPTPPTAPNPKVYTLNLDQLDVTDLVLSALNQQPQSQILLVSLSLVAQSNQEYELANSLLEKSLYSDPLPLVLQP